MQITTTNLTTQQSTHDDTSFRKSLSSGNSLFGNPNLQDYRRILTGQNSTYSPSSTAYMAAVSNSPSLNFVNSKTANTNTETVSFKLSPTDIKKLSIQSFRDAFLTAEPVTTVKYQGVRVLEESKWLGWSGPYHVAWQQTGSNLLVSPRVWMIGLFEAKGTSSDHITIGWNQLDNFDTNRNQFTGPYALQAPKPDKDAVWTPYNSGLWDLNLKTGTITYSVSLDTAGSMPIGESMARTYASQVLEATFGITVK